MIKGIIALVLCALLVAIGASRVFAASEVVMSEVQTTGCREYQLDGPMLCAVDEGAHEFVELTNISLADIDVSGWRIEYLSASHSGNGAPTRVLANLQGKLVAQSSMVASFEGYLQNADVYFGTPSSSGYLAKSGGHVRLVGGSGEVLDHISWGSAPQFSGWPKVAEISGGSAAKRLFPPDPLYSPASPFIIVKDTTPTVGGLQPWECEGVVLSEILPNPAGVDTGNEFIELHNPTTEIVRLSGCSVRLNEGVEFSFANESIPPGEYMALSDVNLGFSLPNSSGGTVWLLTAGNEQGVQYPANMGDGEAWVFAGGSWKSSTTTTKNSVNMVTQKVENGGTQTPLPCPAGKYRHPETNRCRLISSVSAKLAPCKPGQVRSAETNRCRSAMAAATSLTPCKPGQARNPETNRCRSATATSASLTPCKQGQIRNPDTNRCRSTVSSSSALKPCKPGQERNPETNRCRKATSGSGGSEYSVEKTPASPGAPIGWLVAGTAGASVLGYGAYEWRREIGSFFGKLKDKISGGPPG